SVDGGYVVNDGNGGANYSVVTTTAAGTIAKAALVVTGATGNSKVADGSPTTGVSGGAVKPMGSDSVTLDGSGATGTFADDVLGTDKAVTVSGYTLSGPDAANYTLVQPVGITASLMAKPVTVQPLPPATPVSLPPESTGVAAPSF